jgi:hypothetical protein
MNRKTLANHKERKELRDRRRLITTRKGERDRSPVTEPHRLSCGPRIHDAVSVQLSVFSLLQLAGLGQRSFGCNRVADFLVFRAFRGEKWKGGLSGVVVHRAWGSLVRKPGNLGVLSITCLLPADSVAIPLFLLITSAGFPYSRRPLSNRPKPRNHHNVLCNRK